MRQGLNFFLKRIFPNGTTSVPFSSGRQVLGWTPSTATILNQQHQHNLGMYAFVTDQLGLGVACARRAHKPYYVSNSETLKQTCHQEKIPVAPFAFSSPMIHWILQFTLRIAVRCVLHRCASQDIHRWKFVKLYFCMKSDRYSGTVTESHLPRVWDLKQTSHDSPAARQQQFPTHWFRKKGVLKKCFTFSSE